jgi:hypothetical protein
MGPDARAAWDAGGLIGARSIQGLSRELSAGDVLLRSRSAPTAPAQIAVDRRANQYSTPVQLPRLVQWRGNHRTSKEPDATPRHHEGTVTYHTRCVAAAKTKDSTCRALNYRHRKTRLPNPRSS